MTIAEALIPEFDREMESTRKILECVSEGQFAWKPHEKSMTLGRLAGHVAETPSWGVSVMTTENFEPGPNDKPLNPETKAELLEKFDSFRAEAREQLAKATDEDYAVNWTMSWGGRKIIDDPRSTVIRTWVISHMIHHRAQLGVYLRLQNIVFPGVYGPSADDMAAMKQSA